MRRCPGVKVTPFVLPFFCTSTSTSLTSPVIPFPSTSRYHGKIQDHPTSFYSSFNLIITGLDSVEARRWINATLVGMVDEDDPESLVPLIDGGTEGGVLLENGRRLESRR
jgi:hypothetical protein